MQQGTGGTFFFERLNLKDGIATRAENTGRFGSSDSLHRLGELI